MSSLPKAVTWKQTGQDSNPRTFGSQANALPLSHTGHKKKGINKKNYYISLTPQKSSMGGFAPDLAHGFVSLK